MEIVFICLAVFTIIASLMKLIKQDSWWIRFFDFPQVQFVILGFISLGGLVYYWGFNDYKLLAVIVVLLAVLVYQCIIIFPYTWVAPSESKEIKEYHDRQKVSFMIANIYMYNRDYKRCIQLVNDIDPDVLLLVETDKQWEEGMRSIDERYAYAVKYPIDNTYGMLLYSKLELINPEVKFLVESDIPSIHTHIRLRNGEVSRLYALHPKPPSPTENLRSTERDAELYLIAKEVEDVKTPVIVAGDLNDVAWSHSTRMFQRISRLMDPRKGRGFFNTFHAKYPFLRWPLDHVFHSSEFGIANIKRLPAIGSDHFPIYIDLIFVNDKAEEPLIEPATYEEREEANAKIRAAL